MLRRELPQLMLQLLRGDNLPDNKRPPKLRVDAYGASNAAKLASSKGSLNANAFGALDLRTVRRDGLPWDFTKRSNGKLAYRLNNKQTQASGAEARPATTCARGRQGSLATNRTHQERAAHR